MKINDVFSKEFKKYGKVVEGFDLTPLMEALQQTPLPQEVLYIPSDPALWRKKDFGAPLFCPEEPTNLWILLHRRQALGCKKQMAAGSSGS